MSNTHLNTEPEAPPVALKAAEKSTERLLFDIGMTAIQIAALGRIVQDIADDFYEDEISDYLTRLSSLGMIIDKLGQEIASKIYSLDFYAIGAKQS